VLDAYEPAANRIAITVAVGFVQQRERVIREQQEAIRLLSTPVLQVRERLLILPMIGLIDPQRARQLTEQLLRASGRTARRSWSSTSPVWRRWTRVSPTTSCRRWTRRASSARR
jgi:DNA-binding FadR family transcriptional regulator